MKKSFSIRKATRSDFEEIFVLINLSYSLFDKKSLITDRQSTDIDCPPWTWYGDPELSWIVLTYDDAIFGFILWRNKNRNSHLHSFFTNPNVCSINVRKELLDYHEGKISAEHPNIETITAHIAKSNSIAIFSYANREYEIVDPVKADIDEDSGLGDWIKNCISYNNFPLRESLVMMVKYLTK